MSGIGCCAGKYTTVVLRIIVYSSKRHQTDWTRLDLELKNRSSYSHVNKKRLPVSNVHAG